MRWTIGALIGFLFVVAGEIALAHNPDPIIMGPGESRSLTCASGCVGQISGSSAYVAGATLTPTPTAMAMVTATATPPATPTPAHPNHWHPPTTHEHHDEEPQWVKDFIVSRQDVFPGQTRVIYGDNEASSPMENTHKHEAFKGVLLQTTAGGELFWRYHAASNPLDRSAQFHSFEVYVRDTAGNVSFFEGHYDAGDPNDPQARCSLPNPTCGGARPIIIMNGDRTEQWYPSHGLLSFALNITGPTTYYGGLGENATAHDQSTWLLTGKLGTGVEISTEVFISQAATQLAPGVHCASAMGQVGACDSAHPMRYVVAATLADDLRLEYGIWRISTVRRTVSYPCPDCRIPN